MMLIWILEFCILLLLPSLTHQNHKMEEFLATLIQTSFPHCALFFGRQDASQSAELLDLGGLVQRLGIVAYYNGVFENGKKDQSLLSSTNNSSYSGQNNFSLQIGGYNTRASVCKFVIFSVDDVQPAFLEWIRKTISPVYVPLVRIDADPWVWITHRPELLEPLLLSRALPARTKFKLGLSILSPSSDKLVIQSVCFFCNEGQPRILNLPLMDPTIFDYFPDYVLNLMGRLIRISVPAVKARVDADPPYQGVNNAKRGLWKPLLHEYLMPKLNFTYNIFLSSGKDGNRGGGTGLELPDGRWIGTVGDLINDKADMTFITAMTPERLPHVSSTNSFFDLSYLTFITMEGTRVFSPLALLWPFDLLMWGCIFLSTLLSFLIFKFLTWAMKVLGLDSDDAMTFTHRGAVSSKEWGIQHQIFFVATTYLDQDCVMPRSTPLRCFVALWLFFTLIITTIYRSKMVSLLAFPILEKVPSTFDELAFSPYSVGFLKHGDAAYNTFKRSTDPVYVKLVSEMEIITGAGLECLDRVVEKKYACIAYTVSAVYIVARNLSDSDKRQLIFSKAGTYNIFMGLVFQGSSIYRESFERWLAWTRPFHLEYLWEEWDTYYTVRLPKRQWWMETNQTDKLAHTGSSANGGDEDLTLQHVSGAFFAFIACLLICCIVFLQELIYFHRDKVLARKATLNRARTKIKVVLGMNSSKVLF